MSLKEYSRKRSFEKTPEPPPSEKTVRQPGNRFFVQRHHATRLHYDFRLEIDGALVSWAVPKGPSLAAGSKQLAMHVEDHPLDYGNFEGNIPKGNYGAGSVMLWDRGTYQLLGEGPAKDQIARGDLKFHLEGEKLRGDFALVLMKGRGKGNEWLLLKKKDDAADPAWDIEAHAYSILSGRTQEEIAKDLPARKPMTQDKPEKKSKTATKGKPADKGSTPAKKKVAAPVKLPAAAVKAPMPEFIEPMKGLLAKSAPRGSGWVYEIKWDGIRAVCFVDQGSLRMTSRRGNSCERQYPELSVLPHFVNAETAILDGEIAVLDDQGRPSFSLIQPRIMVSDANAAANLARSRPAALFLFDLIYLNGYDLRAVPLIERKELLRSVLEPNPLIRFSEHFEDGEQLLEAAREQGLEGIIAKRADSRYESKRSNCWIKIKAVHQQELVICGYTKGEREHFGALVLGVYERGNLVYAGNVGTGFDEKSLAEVYRRLKPLETSKSPLTDKPKIPRQIVWVKPELVCECKFSEWTHENRLRAPVFLGLRFDVDPRECVREGLDAPESPESTTPREPLLSAEKEQVLLTIDGTQLKFTNLNKIFYPRDGYTKRDVINFYDAVADLLLPHLKDRPLSLKRYPNGIHADYFFQKDSPESFPSWLRFEEVFSEHNQAPIRFVLAENRAAVLYLANLGCIDQNPWQSRAESLENPDWILIDLDPVECPFDMIVEAAQLVREKLDAIGLKGYPKTTGGDGMHVYIPVEPDYSYDQTKSFAEILGALLAAERPDLFTTPRSVARREKGKVYFDHLQNGYGKTIAAPYVLRAHDGAPVATPLEWDEVRPGLTPGQFHIRNAPGRFSRVGDLFAAVLNEPQRIEPALDRLATLMHRPSVSKRSG